MRIKSKRRGSALCLANTLTTELQHEGSTKAGGSPQTHAKETGVHQGLVGIIVE